MVTTGEVLNPEGDSQGVAAPELVRGGWDELPWLRHGFSTRSGGVTEVYGGRTLNLGWTKEDSAEAVAENRRRLVRAAAGEDAVGEGMRLVTVRQVHSDTICVVESAEEVLEGSDGRACLVGDGLMTDVPGLLLGVGTADCVPVLLLDRRVRAVAALHAGWRGTAERIVEKGVGLMRERYGSRAGDLRAAVGPSIGPCCYAVGGEVRERFGEGFHYAAELFGEREDGDGEALKGGDPGRTGIGSFLDLWEANRRQLVDAGLRSEAVEVIGQCTACSREADGSRRYFSHRAERGFAGRMLSVIGIVAEPGHGWGLDR